MAITCRWLKIVKQESNGDEEAKILCSLCSSNFISSNGANLVKEKEGSCHEKLC